MLPILTDQQVRTVERSMVAAGAVRSIDLMERAGAAVARRILELEGHGAFGSAPLYVVFVGMGNNGGDGLVVARLLHKSGRSVRVILVQHRPTSSGDRAMCLDRATLAGVPLEAMHAVEDLPFIAANEVLIDAILGTGADRPLEGSLLQLVDRLQDLPNRVVSIDRPTGTTIGPMSTTKNKCLRAQHTIVFQVPRPYLFHPGIGEAAGAWYVEPVGLDRVLLAQERPYAQWLEVEDIRAMVHPVRRFSHKGDRGHALLIAGSTGMHGAAVLATGGCARSGVGLFTVHAPMEALQALGTCWPDAMTCPDHGPASLRSWVDGNRATALGIGPGLGATERADTLLNEVIACWNGPLVLDADALNGLARHPDWLRRLPPITILTPHPKEMDRLLGMSSPDPEARFQRTRSFAHEHRCHVLLKGAFSVICTPDGEAIFNSTGNAGMAKGGTGDVLTGLLTGLLAQGYTAREASLLGCYLHGSAGDLAAQRLGTEAMRASDLVTDLPSAWGHLMDRDQNKPSTAPLP